MDEKQIIGHCPKCGCPIYQSVYWAGSGYPPAEYICKCDLLPNLDEMYVVDESGRTFGCII